MKYDLMVIQMNLPPPETISHGFFFGLVDDYNSRGINKIELANYLKQVPCWICGASGDKKCELRARGKAPEQCNCGYPPKKI